MSDIRQQTLDWINGIREDLNLPKVDRLYKGVPKEAGHCVIANTLVDDTPDRIDFVEVSPDSLDTGYLEFSAVDENGERLVGSSEYDTYRTIELPKFANQLALEFDNGGHPDLEIAR